MDLRAINATLSVSPQILANDLQKIADQGYRSVTHPSDAEATVLMYL